MENHEALKPCPFCGGSAGIAISDDEGNHRDEEYELDPWSGLSFRIQHSSDENPDCPIANFPEDGAVIGTFLYDTRAEAAEAWNKRHQ